MYVFNNNWHFRGCSVITVNGNICGTKFFIVIDQKRFSMVHRNWTALFSAPNKRNDSQMALLHSTGSFLNLHFCFGLVCEVRDWYGDIDWDFFTSRTFLRCEKRGEVRRFFLPRSLIRNKRNKPSRYSNRYEFSGSHKPWMIWTDYRIWFLDLG